MSNTPVWSPITEPKRKFKFVLNINNIPAYTIKTTDRPQISVGEAKHEFFLHDFYFPGRVTWNELSISLIDPIDVNTSKKLLDYIKDSGYVPPSEFSETPGDPNFLHKTIAKKAFVSTVGQITIQTLDSEGNVLETWELKNPWIKSVNYNNMSYGDEGLVELGLTIRYDWAVLN